MSDGTSSKWNGVLVTALKKVQRQVHPTLAVEGEALFYLEDLNMKLMHQLCSGILPTIPDVEQKITNLFPPQILKWAIGSARAAIGKAKKKNVTFSVDKLFSLIQKEFPGFKIEGQLALYIVAVLEYISADILKLAGNYVKNIRHFEITSRDIKVAMNADKVLASMFYGEDIENVAATTIQPTSKRGSLTYIEVLKDFMMWEEQFIRELNLIIKVFRKPMTEAPDLFTQEDIDSIFSNLDEVLDFTVQFYSVVESTFEMADEKSEPLIGDIFEEMAEAAEFECYDTYAYEQVGNGEVEPYEKIKSLLEKPGVKEFFKQASLHDAVKYILPKLLYGPIHHCDDYFEYINLLMCTSPDGQDREKLDEALSILRGLQLTIKKMGILAPLRRNLQDQVFYTRTIGMNAPNSVAKMNSIQENLEGWEGKDICQIASLFLKEGSLNKIGKKSTERKVFLFDNLMLCAKQNKLQLGFSQAEYRLKELIYLRKVEIRDVENSEDMQLAFEILQTNDQMVTFSCKDERTKYEWLSLLMALNHRSTLDRMLDVLLQDDEQSIELKTPDSSVYIFATPDSGDNIIFEEEDSGIPIIKGGTLYKLVERLTYHKYADPTFIRVFLTTYRSFSNPVELLDYLIKRYDIPEPLAEGRVLSREDLKKFRKEYSHPIQLRVLNVLRHWVDQHFYDFQREEMLLGTLQKFLSRVIRNKTARKWVETIEKMVNRRLELVTIGPESYSFNLPPPPIEWHHATSLDKFNLLTLHPLEIGRQLTIMQSEIFRSIRPSELVGTVWTKKDRNEKLSPNTLKMIRLSTLLTYWYEMSIVEAHNFEERVAVYVRIIDILMVFLELNNFNGMMEILGALNSAPVFRLVHTKSVELSPKRSQALQEVKDLTDDGHNMKYMEKLRSINPPCVPFLGIYLSNILKAEEGNPDYLSNCGDGLINFSKRRMVADITGEILKYQNMPYNLQVQPVIRKYLEDLDPLAGRSTIEMNDYLYELSLIVEPRNSKQPAKFTRKTDIPMKSPGIKPNQRSFSTSRKSTSSIHDVELRRPPSPTPSTSSSFSTFTINEEDSMEESEEEVDSPPPMLLPRHPFVTQNKTEIHEMLKSVPPVLPPKSIYTGKKTLPNALSENKPEILPRRSGTLNDDIAPPSLPLRSEKPI